MTRVARAPLAGRPVWNVASALALGAVGAVAAVAWTSLLLAQLGRHALAPVAVGAGALVLCGFLWVRRDLAAGAAARPRPGDAIGGNPGHPALALALLLAGAAWIFFPGFPFGLADRDPGVYLAQAALIDRTGGLALEDPVVDPDSGLAWTDARGWRLGETRFPGFWVQDREERRVVLQFYALYPALMATAISAGGLEGAVATNPALATLSVGLLFLIVRAAAGTPAALLAALLLGAQMLEVWQAKYPTAEILTQFLLLGATLAFLAARERRSVALAAFAGILTGCLFLARPDGLALVAAAALAAIGAICVFGADAVTRGFLLGLGGALAHALVQAYHPHLARLYTLREGLPDARWIALALALGVLSLAFAPRFRPRLNSWLARCRRYAPAIAHLAVAAFTLVLALGYARPWLAQPHRAPDGLRTFNEESLYRLTWFFTPRGMVLLWTGFALVAWTSLRRRPAAQLLVAPVLLVLPVLLYDPRVDAGLMWWTRRFVPYTLPGMVALVAIGIAGLVAAATSQAAAKSARATPRARAGRILAALLAAAVAVELGWAWLAMSLPLRHHREMQGTFELIDALGELGAGRRAVLLWHSSRHTHSPGFCFGGPAWAYHGQLGALLPFDVSAEEVLHWAAMYPDQSIFLVADDEVPPALASLPFVRHRDFEVRLPMWEESSERRPDRFRFRRFGFSVWRLERESGGVALPAAEVPSQEEPEPLAPRARQSSPSGASTDSRTTPSDILERPTRRSR